MTASPLQKYKTTLNISSWLTFVVSLFFYWITVDPGASYWDCPEYVTMASKMEIGHPPGNPVWMLAMRVATIPFSAQHHALIINLCSGLFMAFAAFFLCRIIFIPTRLFLQRYFNSTRDKDILSLFIATGASLCFALCDSAWFSAVEAEVYAMSAFLASSSLWVMMVWWFEKSKSKQFRLLVLLAYLTGLSLGVHQLNLLLIPVFTLIILYRIHPGRLNIFFVAGWVIISCGLIGLILMGLIPGVLYAAESFELFGVNSLGLPYNSGIIIWTLLILSFLLILIAFTNQSNKYRGHREISVLIWISAFLFLGFSSFGIVMIRSNAYPYMNEGVPDNIFSLNSYISRDQYPSSPLIYGGTPYSKPMLEEEIIAGETKYTKYILNKGKAKYQPISPNARLNHRSRLLSHEDSLNNEYILNKGYGYIISDYDFTHRLTPELDMWFPRITSRKLSDRLAYSDWAGMTEETMDRIPISETVDSLCVNRPRVDLWGNREPTYSYKPTYLQNLRYFMSYQAFYMYFRYLFWNFIGRQNDYHSIGEIEHGNFITGIPVIDKAMIGDTSAYPPELWDQNPGRNRYFGIPFIFGMLGIIWLLFQKRQGRRILSIITLIFLMTGLAIVVYLNQLPGEPRERDYTFLGSYMSFSMWIAAGFIAVSCFITKYFKRLALLISGLIAFTPATIMAIENFDDHDRSERYEPAFFASSLLDFEIPSIIFSHGDNSTFPLWYVSEVLSPTNQHTIIDATYMSLPSYIVNLKKQGKKGISTLLQTPQMEYDAYVLTRIPPDSTSFPISLTDALQSLYSSKDMNPLLPSSLIKIPISNNDSVTINLHDFTGGSSYLSFKHLMLLDIIASEINSENPKPIYFPSLIDHSLYKPLEPYLKETLFGKIYAPRLSDSIADNLLKQAVVRELSKLENINTSDHYVDPVTADRRVRYRGELIMAANQLLLKQDTTTSRKIVESIERIFPYQKLLPGTFTVSDSTYFEGKEYRDLLKKIYLLTSDQYYLKKHETIDSLMTKRYEDWLIFYKSLTPAQRKTLSNRSRRLLMK